MDDTEIINGLLSPNDQRRIFEKRLYTQYKYLIEDACFKHKITYDDSFSAYSDAVLSVIQNIVAGRFNQESSIKTYLSHIFSNKCIDIIRSQRSNKEKVHQILKETDLLNYLPDTARIVIDKLIDQQRVDEIKKHLDAIGEKCKEILLLFEEGYKDKYIAERLAYNSASVAKITRLRCLDKLKEKMKNHFVRNE